MDVSSVLKNEIFRPLTTIVVPGAFAIAPYVLIFFHCVPEAKRFWIDSPNAFGVALFLTIVACGLVLENVGSRIEKCWDEKIAPDAQARQAAWNKYLKLRIGDEYVGQRYLRTVVTRFKFELSMAPALFLFSVGVVMGDGAVWIKFWLSVVPMVVCFLLTWDSYLGARVLADTRAVLVEAEEGRPPRGP